MIKYNRTISDSLAPLVVVLMLFVVSCTKTECVSPNEPLDNGSVTTKGLPTTYDSGPAVEGGQRDGDEPVVTGHADGIGDDGDDLSDTERNRKKK